MSAVKLPLVVASAIVSFLLFLAFPLLNIFANFSHIYVEGWNAYFGIIAVSGKPLYGDVLISPDYPPLCYYFFGILGKIFGSIVTTGRVVSVLSLVGVSYGIFHLLKRLTGDGRLAILGGLWAFVLFAVLAPEYLGMNSPQFFAHLMMMASMIFYSKFRTEEGLNWRWLVLSAVCAVSALYIKHNLLAFPLAVTLDLLFFSRRGFVVWVLGFYGLGAVILLALNIHFDGRLIPLILGKRQYSIRLLFDHIQFSALVLSIPVICSFKSALQIVKSPSWRWVALYFGIALILGVAAYGGVGIDVNLFFDLVIALGILLPLSVCDSDFFRGPIVRWSFLVFLGLASLLRLSTTQSLENFRFKGNTFQADVAFLASIPGHAICEDLLVCFWAGKELSYEPFLVSQAVRTGELDEEVVLKSLRERRWTAIQLILPEVSNRFTESFLAVLHEHYLPQPTNRDSKRIFYLPR